MPTLRCSMCSIDYPHSHTFTRCRVCGGLTSYFSDVDADPDWAESVRLKKGVGSDPSGSSDVKADRPKEYWWRAEELYRAGFDYEAALYLATRADVDLHAAVRLVRSAGPDLAFEILR